MQNNELDERRNDDEDDNLPQGVAQSISTATKQDDTAAIGTAGTGQEVDVEMKDEAGDEGTEGSKVPLPWAFIDCEIDSLIELVGEYLLAR